MKLLFWWADKNRAIVMIYFHIGYGRNSAASCGHGVKACRNAARFPATMRGSRPSPQTPSAISAVLHRSCRAV